MRRISIQQNNEFKFDQRIIPRTQVSTSDTWQINEKVFSRESKDQLERGNTCGLDNLGNSCYMNSVLQVLSHTPNIMRYFVDGQYDKDKDKYKLNCIISEELQTIMLNLQMGTQKSFSPKRFKNAAREYIEILDNNEQQDSAHFLIQLLDLIHNELTDQSINKAGSFKEVKGKNDKSQKLKNNKVISAQNRSKVEESIISKNIQGKYSRTMFCEECKFESTSEDDFIVFSLRIPPIKQVSVHLKFYPAEPINGDIVVDYDFMFDSDQSLISEVQSKLKLSKDRRIYYEYYMTSESNGDLVLINKRSSIQKISENFNSELQYTIHLYELYRLENPWDYYDFKLCDKNKDSASFHRQISIFKISIDQNDPLSELQNILYNHLILRTEVYNGLREYLQIKMKKYYKIYFDFKAKRNKKCPICNSRRSHPCEINLNNKLIFKKLLNGQENQKSSFKIFRLQPNDDNLQSFAFSILNCHIIKVKSSYDGSLKSCFTQFISDEIYPNYNCDECGKLANCITKTTMSKLPKYLVIQLMRFESDGSYAQSVLNKNKQFVDFPTKDLDLSNIYSGSLNANCIYDLYGVIHHSDEGGFDHFYATIRDSTKSKYWNLYRGKVIFEKKFKHF